MQNFSCISISPFPQKPSLAPDDVFAHNAHKLMSLPIPEVPGVGVLTFQYVADPEGSIIEIQQIEKRIQIYTEGAEQEKIITRRRYVSKQEVNALLKQTGFSDIRVTHEYDESESHPLREEEVTDSPFVCTTSKYS